MACGESNGHVTDDATLYVTMTGQGRDPNMLRAQYLTNDWR